MATTLLALALADQDRLPEARRMLVVAKELGGGSQQFAIRFRIRLADARLAVAGGQTRAAVRLLEDLEGEAERAGFQALRFEARLHRLLVERNADGLAQLSREAGSAGIRWIAERAGAALAG